MSSMLWRIIYAVVCFVMFMLVVPLFFDVVGFAVQGSLWQLLRICVACLAVLYVFFGPEPPRPF